MGVFTCEPPPQAIEAFQTHYERHYGIILPLDEAAQKLDALVSLLAAARGGSRASGGLPERRGHGSSNTVTSSHP